MKLSSILTLIMTAITTAQASVAVDGTTAISARYTRFADRDATESSMQRKRDERSGHKPSVSYDIIPEIIK